MEPHNDVDVETPFGRVHCGKDLASSTCVVTDKVSSNTLVTLKLDRNKFMKEKDLNKNNQNNKDNNNKKWGGFGSLGLKKIVNK